MTHNLKISVSNSPLDGGIVSLKVIPIKNPLLRKLIGNVDRMTVIIPGDTVQNITISEIKEREGKPVCHQ